ncbi:hypothetical protein BJ944DRAFT_32235, partial [Cunninghamella echinulata]
DHLVGIALIFGVLSWINRKGGCTKRRNTRDDIFKSSDEDYTIDIHPSPNMKHTNPLMSNIKTSNSIVPTKLDNNNVSPVLPFDHSRRFIAPPSNNNNTTPNNNNATTSAIVTPISNTALDDYHYQQQDYQQLEQENGFYYDSSNNNHSQWDYQHDPYDQQHYDPYLAEQQQSHYIDPYYKPDTADHRTYYKPNAHL